VVSRKNGHAIPGTLYLLWVAKGGNSQTKREEQGESELPGIIPTY
jgi:hypothetical protein